MDEWRIARNNAYLIHCSLSPKPVDITEFSPLPLDWELKNLEEGEQDETVYLYEEAKRLGYFQSKIA